MPVTHAPAPPSTAFAVDPSLPEMINSYLSARSNVWIASTSILLIGLIGLLDYLTGYELSFSLFYLLPVALGAWYAGPRAGAAACVASVLVWLWVDSAAGHSYSHGAIPFWNGLVRLGLFGVVAHLLWRLRAALDAQTALALHDDLTGVLNARALKQQYDALAGTAIRHRRPIALGYIDLDGFKTVNDSLGHSGGDRILKAVASTLAQRSRASDLVGRVGGDEFVVLLPETGAAGARIVFTDLQKNLRALAADNDWPIGFSIGVVVFYPPPAGADEAIKAADALMYAVKRAGKGGLMVEEHVNGARSG
ncbi:MAG: GGDEF domain-containing protein [Burkholderiaceae bacterium]